MASSVTSHSLIARRYAGALFDLAEGPSLDAVTRDFESLRQMLAGSDDLKHAVSSPLIARDVRTRAISALASAAQFNDLTQRFLGVVSENNRLFAIDGIATAFLAEVAMRRGLSQVEVISAKPLNDMKRAAIEHALNTALASKTSLTVTVDPSLIGGIVIRAGSRLIDASIKTQLDRLGRILKTAA